MLFAIICHDKKDSSSVRMANRPAHLEYLGGHKEKAFAAGPMMTDDGDGMIGSLLIMDFADKAEVESFAAGDPYNQAGLFETVTVVPWKKVIPAD